MRNEPAIQADEWAELAEYLGERFDPDKALNTAGLVAAEFRRHSSLDQFYRNSEAYLYDLTRFAQSNTKEPYRALVRMVAEPGAHLVDFGCGIGSNGLRFAAEGYDVTFVDFDNPSTAYLRWRLERRGLRRPVLDVERLPDGLRCDLVYCFDVLEHVEDPAAFLRRLESIGSFVAVNFIREEHSEQFPMHFSHDWEALLARIEAEHTVLFKEFLYPNSQLLLYAVGKVAVRPLLTVVTPTRNRAQILEVVLAGLAGQTLPRCAFEVVVGDDHSEDRTWELLADPPLPVRGVKSAQGGAGGARNAALELARGPLVLFLDDDVEPLPTCLAEHLLFHLRNPRPTDAALGYVEWPKAEVTPFMRLIESGEGLFAWPQIQLLAERGLTLDFRFFYTCNLSLKRELLGDQRFEPDKAMEDTELGYRLIRDRGLALHFLPGAVGRHHTEKTYSQFLSRQRLAGEAAVWMAGKHPELAAQLGALEEIEPQRDEARLERLGEAIAALEPIAPALVGKDGPGPADFAVVAALNHLYAEGMRTSYRLGIEAARRALDTPLTASQWHRAGLEAHAAGDPDEALRCLERSVAIRPDPEALNDLAVVVAERGELAAARALLERCLELWPDNAAARENLEALHRVAETVPALERRR